MLAEARDTPTPSPEVSELIMEVVRREGLGVLAWTDRANELRARMSFMHHRHRGWPDVSHEALVATLDEWLTPHLVGITSVRDDAPSVEAALREMLSWQQRAELDRLAPPSYVAPTGTRAPIDYSNPTAPSVAIRLQEMFGVRETPAVDGGSVPLTLELLSPARRIIQVTSDIAKFWSGSYADVRKEMRGRYPKHHWPDDPLSATPTTRSKPR